MSEEIVQSAPMQEITTLAAPVVEVTLLEDRAHVVRRGRIRMAAGRARLRVEDVAPVLHDKTLMARVEAHPHTDQSTSISSPASCDVHVERRTRVLDEDRPEDIRAIETELEALTEELGHWRSLLKSRQQSVKALDELARQNLSEMRLDASWSHLVEPTELQEDLARYAARERQVADQILLLEEQIRNGMTRAGDLGRHLQAKASPEADMSAAIVLEVELEASQELEIEIDYIVPGACWRPYYTAELEEDEQSLHFRTDACVWQRTGENWEGVSLYFSTQRSSLGIEAPQLAEDVLRTRKKPEEMQVVAREQAIHTTGLGADESPTEGVPGVDDGGEVQRLSGIAPAVIPSDGQAYRLTLSEFEEPVRLERVLSAELTPAVLFKSQQRNAGTHPILAGPVDLIRHRGLTGRTQIGFVAPGERFDLGWGPDSALRVERSERKREEEGSRLSSWLTRRSRVDIHISNLAPETRSIEVTERVPVSETEKVEIVPSPDKTSQGRTPDADGFVRWQLELPAFGCESIRLEYDVKRDKKVAGL